MMMLQLLKLNYHQKKWLKFKHKLKLRPMLLQHPKLLFKLLIQIQQENYLQQRKLKSKLKLKLRQVPKQDQLVMLLPKLMQLICKQLLPMKQQQLKQLSLMQEQSFN